MNSRSDSRSLTPDHLSHGGHYKKTPPDLVRHTTTLGGSETR
ncbi:unnamed protein product [Brassica oleracea]